MLTLTVRFVLRAGLCAATLAAPGFAQAAVAGTTSAAVAPVSSKALSTDGEIARAADQTTRTPARDTAWTALSDAFMQKARETSDAAYYSRAEAAYRKALGVNPKCVDALAGMAWVEGGRHAFEESREWATKALAIDAKYAAAYGLIGDAAVEMGDYDEAFDQYQKMLDVRPGLPSYSRSAHLLHVTGDTRRATWLMAKAVAAGSPYAENTAWCRAQMALIYFSDGAYLPARQVLEEGLRLAPGDYHLLAAMGKVMAGMKDYKTAIDYYSRAAAIAPQQDLVAALGDLYAVTGQPQEAQKKFALVESIASINKANRVKGDMITARFYADHDIHLEEALRMAQEEYKTRKSVYAADTLAWVCFKNGDLTNARKYIALALKQNTPEALFHFHEGMIYSKSGDVGRARQSLYEALSLSPNFDPVYAPIAMGTLHELGMHTAGEVVAATRE